MEIRLRSRFVVVMLIGAYNRRCLVFDLGFALTLVLILCGFTLGPVLRRWLRTGAIPWLVFDISVGHRSNPWPNFCPVGAGCLAGLCLGLLLRTLNLMVATRAGRRKTGTGAFRGVSGYRTRAAAGSWAPRWAEANT